MSDRFSTLPLTQGDFDEGEDRGVAWRDRWRLFHLADGQRWFGSAAKQWWYEPGSSTVPQAMVLVGEEGAGLSSFLNWLGRDEASGGDTRRLVLVDTSKPPLRGRDWQEQMDDLWSRLRIGLDEEPQAPPGWLPSQSLRGRAVTLVLLGTRRLNEVVASVLFADLRAVVEGRSLGAARLVVCTHEPAALATGPFSSLSSVCQVYRLGYLRPEDIDEIWQAEKSSAPEGVSAGCFEWTGGQPLLVNVFLAGCRDHRDLEPDQIGRGLRDDPPRNVKLWQTRLAELVAAPEPRRIVEALVNRQRLQRLHDVFTMRHLFAGGWVRIEQTDDEDPATRHWVVRSESHAEWARDVLRETTALRRQP